MRRTGFEANDAHTRYQQMRSPAERSPELLAELRTLTRDEPETDNTVRVGRSGRHALRVPMRTNDVVFALLEPVGSE